LNDPEDLVAAKDFISKRYELIYNSHLWKDTLVQVDVSVDPDDDDNALGIVLMPEVIDRVVAVRTADRSIRIRGLEDYYGIDANKFPLSGTVYEGALLYPIWFNWRGLAGLQITSVAADNGAIVKVIWKDDAQVKHTQKLTLSNAVPPTIEYLPLTNTVVVSGAGTSAVNGTYTWSKTLSRFVLSSDYHLSYSGGTTGFWALFYTPTSEVKYYNNNPDITLGTWLIDTASAPAPTVAAGVKSTFEIESFFKPETAGAVTLEIERACGYGNIGGTLATTETAGGKHQRIRLFSLPTSSFTLNVLGKKKFEPLDFDSEVPALKNLDNCLISFAVGDMWARGRHLGKAQACYQEGAMLLGELAKIETVQAANHSLIRPEWGYGNSIDNRKNSSGNLF